MGRLLVRWTFTALSLVFGVSALTFVLAGLVPGDAARAILGINADPAQYQQLRRQLGLDEPLWEQYIGWLSHAVRGDLGTSIQSAGPVGGAIAGRLPVTLCLVGGAIAVAALLGVALGVTSAVRGGVAGKIVDVFGLLGLAVPVYWLGLVLVALLSVEFQVFPATGYVGFGQSPVRWFESLVLPVVTLGFGSCAPIAKQTRDSMLTELGRDYVAVLRARGISEPRIVLRHALRNAATPVLSVAGLVLVGLFGGAVLAETVFVLPGLGSLAVTAASTHDIPVIQGVAIVFTLLVVGVNLLVEIGYAALNPKVRT